MTSKNEEDAAGGSGVARKKCRILSSQAREIVYNVNAYFTAQKEAFNIKGRVANHTAMATGTSLTTVKRILKEGKRSMNSSVSEPIFQSPSTKRKRPKKIKFEESFEEELRRTIHEFYAEKQCPSTKRILEAMRENGTIPECGKETLRKKIHEIGIKWKKSCSKKQRLTEIPELYMEKVETCANQR